MGWGRMLLLGNWGQQMDIEDQRLEIQELKHQLESSSPVTDRNAKTKILQLEKENSELRLYLASLIKYLGHKGVLNKDDFRTLVETIDSEDGSIDVGYKGRIVK